MANDAFALSPISASGTLPSEADYQAISEAFMETSRGRWFLKEYARRNRNADTAMVLEAVARVESIVAAQKQEAAAPPVAKLADSVETIRSAIDEARATASKALAELQSDTALAPARKGLRVILEVAWRLREIGYDTRICDILETQASAIAASHDALARHDAPATVLASFDLIARKISELADETATPEPAPAPVAENVVSLWPSSPNVSETTPAEVAEIAVEPPIGASIGETPAAMTDAAVEPAPAIETMAQPVAAVADIAETGTAEALAVGSAETAVAAIADDANAPMSDISTADADESTAPATMIGPQLPAAEAVTETGLAETERAETTPAKTAMPETGMAEPATEPESATIAAFPVELPAEASVVDTPFASMEEAVVAAATVPPAVHPIDAVADELAPELAIAAMVEIAGQTSVGTTIANAPRATAEKPVAAVEPPPVQPAETAAEAPVSEPKTDDPPASLGSALIALGMVSTPTVRSDPLAPLRRMSQAERVAFFS